MKYLFKYFADYINNYVVCILNEKLKTENFLFEKKKIKAVVLVLYLIWTDCSDHIHVLSYV